MAIIFRNPDVLWREEEEALSAVVGRIEQDEDGADIATAVLFLRGSMLSINYLGLEIWKICDQSSFDEVIRKLLEQFEVEESVLRADVQTFLDQLAKKGFVRYEQ